MAEERQGVGEESGVPASHALHANAGGSEGGRGRLDAHATHFIQHHDDVAGGHEHLFFDLLALEDFDAHGRILDAYVVAGGVDGDLLFPRLGGVEFELHEPFARGVDIEQGGGREMAFPGGGDLHGSGGDGRGYDAVGAGDEGSTVQRHLGAGDGFRFGHDFHFDGGLRRLRE